MPAAVPAERDPTPPATMLSRFEHDLDGDGAPESLELWVDAERDAEGRLMLDDGQRWAVYVRDGEWTHVLLDERVQIGRVELLVYEPEGAPAVIVVERRAGAGLSVQTFERDGASGGWVARPALSLTGNLLHEAP